MFRLRQPTSQSRKPQIILLLHGLTGDEFSMWVFVQQPPQNALFIAPRAPFTTTSKGFSWTNQNHHKFPTTADFSLVTDACIEALEGLLNNLKYPNCPIHLIGFSQGAALAYYWAVTYAVKIGKVACLAGFLPQGIEPAIKSGALIGKEFFIAHGSLDETVPVHHAREAAQKLQEGKAKVIYCEDNSGHKLGPSCFRGLNAFIKTIPDIN